MLIFKSSCILIRYSDERNPHDYTQLQQDINDYKFFCFNGRVEFMKVDFDRHTHHRANYYDRDFKLLDFFECEYPNDKKRNISKPKSFDKMIGLAETLAKKHKFVRIDFYDVNGHIYFGEMTFYPASGISKFSPADADYEIGKLLHLQ